MIPRIYNIQTEECFAFSTRERAPIFVCLEVVDFGVSLKQSTEENNKKWWKPELGIKKSIKRAIDTFGEHALTTRDREDANQECTESLINSNNSKASTQKLVLGDRVTSAPLLSELCKTETPDDSSIEKHSDKNHIDSSKCSAPVTDSWAQSTDIEAQQSADSRLRIQILPSRDSATRPH